MYRKSFLLYTGGFTKQKGMIIMPKIAGDSVHVQSKAALHRAGRTRAGAPGEDDRVPAAAAKGVPSLAAPAGRGSAAVLVAAGRSGSPAHHTRSRDLPIKIKTRSKTTGRSNIGSLALVQRVSDQLHAFGTRVRHHDPDGAGRGTCGLALGQLLQACVYQSSCIPLYLRSTGLAT